MKLLTPSCPRCGCLARGMVETRKVMLDITFGLGGEVVEHSRKVLGRTPQPLAGTVSLMCGGHHEWVSGIEHDEDDA